MTKYENKELKGTTLVIEDCFFINCVLRECDLFYSGGDAEFVIFIDEFRKLLVIRLVVGNLSGFFDNARALLLEFGLTNEEFAVEHGFDPADGAGPREREPNREPDGGTRICHSAS